MTSFVCGVAMFKLERSSLRFLANWSAYALDYALI